MSEEIRPAGGNKGFSGSIVVGASQCANMFTDARWSVAHIAVSPSIVVPALPESAGADQILDFAATVGAIAALGHCAESSRIAGAYLSKWGQP